VIYLFIHQRGPGQYRHIIGTLAAQPGNRIYLISQTPADPIEGVHRLVYAKPERPPGLNCHPLTIDVDDAIRVGATVADVCRKLRDDGVRPDLIVGHGGWGETLFVKELFPEARLLSYFEFYYHAKGVDLDFDPEFASVFIGADRLRARNAISLMAFDGCDWGNTATRWQRSRLPDALRERVSVLHEGVDTRKVRPNSRATFTLPDRKLKLGCDDEVIRYVARTLEPYRGFHIFMRALPRILRRHPRAHVLIVGEDGVSYGALPPVGATYREMMLKEVGRKLDLDRVHFLGKLPYERYLRVLQISSAHVYLTYPFILSWSFIEAMACGCVMIGSATPPVLEVLEDRMNGLTVDFFSPRQVADRIDEALDSRDGMAKLRSAARRTAVERYDLDSKIVPKWRSLFADLVSGRRPALEP